MEAEYRFLLEFVEGVDFEADNALFQTRSLWTAMCMHDNLDVDTAEYNRRCNEIWEVMQENPSCPFSPLQYGTFYYAMRKYLA